MTSPPSYSNTLLFLLLLYNSHPETIKHKSSAHAPHRSTTPPFCVYRLQGLEDASQDLYPPADAYRLGGEHGLGGWGVGAGGGGGAGLGYLPGGAGVGAGGGGGDGADGDWGGGGAGAGAGAQGGGGGGVAAAGRDVDFHDEMLLRAEAGDVSCASRGIGCVCVVGLSFLR